MNRNSINQRTHYKDLLRISVQELRTQKVKERAYTIWQMSFQEEESRQGDRVTGRERDNTVHTDPRAVYV